MRWFLMFVLVLVISTGSVQARVEIEAWIIAGTEAARVLQDFTDEAFSSETGIWVNIMTMTWDDAMTKLFMAAASGEVPDVAQMGSTWSGEFGVRGAILDMREAFGEEYDQIASRMYPGSMRPLEFRNTGWGLPVNIGNMISYVRTDIFESHGWEPPQTWDEAISLLPKMQARKMNIGLDYGGGGLTWYVASAFFRQAGGDIYEPGGLVSTLGSPESIDGFIRYTDLFTRHGLPLQTEPFNMFRNGDVPFITLGVLGIYGALEHGAPELAGRWDLAPVPGTILPDGRISNTGYLGTNNYSILQNAAHPKEAWEWVKWFVSAPVQAEYSRRVLTQVYSAYRISPNIEAMLEIPIDPRHREIIRAQLDNDIGIPFSIGGEYVQRYVVNAIHRTVLQGEDPTRSILKASDETTAEMQRKNIEFHRFLSRLPQ